MACRTSCGKRVKCLAVVDCLFCDGLFVASLPSLVFTLALTGTTLSISRFC